MARLLRLFPVKKIKDISYTWLDTTVRADAT